MPNQLPHEVLAGLDSGIKTLLEGPGALEALGIGEEALQQTPGAIMDLLQSKLPKELQEEVRLVEQAGGRMDPLTSAALLRGEKISAEEVILRSKGYDVNAVNKRFVKALIAGEKIRMLNDLWPRFVSAPGAREYLEKVVGDFDQKMVLSFGTQQTERGQNWDKESGKWGWYDKLGLKSDKPEQKKIYEKLEQTGLLKKAIKEEISFKDLNPDQIYYVFENLDVLEVFNLPMLKQLRGKKPLEQWYQGAFTTKIKDYNLDTSYEPGMKLFTFLENEGIESSLGKRYFDSLRSFQIQFLLEHLSQLKSNGERIQMLRATPGMKEGALWYAGEFLPGDQRLDVNYKPGMKLYLQMRDLGLLGSLSVPFGELTGAQVRYLTAHLKEMTHDRNEWKVRVAKVHTYEDKDGWSGVEYNKDYLIYDVDPREKLQRDVFRVLQKRNLLSPGLNISKLTVDQQKFLLDQSDLSAEQVAQIRSYEKSKAWCPLRKRFESDIRAQKLNIQNGVQMRVFLDLKQRGLSDALPVAFGTLNEAQLAFLRAYRINLTTAIIGKIDDVKEGDVLTQEGKIEHPLDRYGVNHSSPLCVAVATRLVKRNMAKSLTVKLSVLSDAALRYLDASMGKVTESQVAAIQEYSDKKEWDGEAFIDKVKSAQEVKKSQLKLLFGKKNKEMEKAREIFKELDFPVPYEPEDLSSTQLEYLNAFSGKVTREFVRSLRLLEPGGEWDAKNEVFLTAKEVEKKKEEAEKTKKEKEEEYTPEEKKKMKGELMKEFGVDERFAVMFIQECPHFIDLVLSADDEDRDLDYYLEREWRQDPTLAEEFYSVLGNNIPLQNRMKKFLSEESFIGAFLSRHQRFHPCASYFKVSYDFRQVLATKEDEEEMAEKEYGDVTAVSLKKTRIKMAQAAEKKGEGEDMESSDFEFGETVAEEEAQIVDVPFEEPAPEVVTSLEDDRVDHVEISGSEASAVSEPLPIAVGAIEDEEEVLDGGYPEATDERFQQALLEIEKETDDEGLSVVVGVDDVNAGELDQVKDEEIELKKEEEILSPKEVPPTKMEEELLDVTAEKIAQQVYGEPETLLDPVQEDLSIAGKDGDEGLAASVSESVGSTVDSGEMSDRVPGAEGEGAPFVDELSDSGDGGVGLPGEMLTVAEGGEVGQVVVEGEQQGVVADQLSGEIVGVVPQHAEDQSAGLSHEHGQPASTELSAQRETPSVVEGSQKSEIPVPPNKSEQQQKEKQEKDYKLEEPAKEKEEVDQLKKAEEVKGVDKEKVGVEKPAEVVQEGKEVVGGSSSGQVMAYEDELSEGGEGMADHEEELIEDDDALLDKKGEEEVFELEKGLEGEGEVEGENDVEAVEGEGGAKVVEDGPVESVDLDNEGGIREEVAALEVAEVEQKMDQPEAPESHEEVEEGVEEVDVEEDISDRDFPDGEGESVQEAVDEAPLQIEDEVVPLSSVPVAKEPLFKVSSEEVPPSISEQILVEEEDVEHKKEELSEDRDVLSEDTDQKELQGQIAVADTPQAGDRQKSALIELRTLLPQQSELIVRAIEIMVVKKGMTDPEAILALLFGAGEYERRKREKAELVDLLKRLLHEMLADRASLGEVKEVLSEVKEAGIVVDGELAALVRQVNRELERKLREK